MVPVTWEMKISCEQRKLENRVMTYLVRVTMLDAGRFLQNLLTHAVDTLPTYVQSWSILDILKVGA